MTLNPLRIDHTAITVRDMAKSVAFYRDVLGCHVLGEAVRDNGTVRMVFLKAGEARLELFEFAHKGREIDLDTTSQDLGLKHVAFRVDDVDAFADALKAKGVEFTVEPKDGYTVDRLAFFRDPDGNLLEIVAGQRNVLKPFEQ
jgi:glyoxylase I family protein